MLAGVCQFPKYVRPDVAVFSFFRWSLCRWGRRPICYGPLLPSPPPTSNPPTTWLGWEKGPKRKSSDAKINFRNTFKGNPRGVTRGLGEWIRTLSGFLASAPRMRRSALLRVTRGPGEWIITLLGFLAWGPGIRRGALLRVTGGPGE